MASRLQLRKGTTAQHATFTGALAEVTVDTTKKVVVVHDNTTVGGIPMATESSVTNGLSNKVDKNANITAGTATKVTYDAKGLVTSGSTLTATDIPVLDTSKLTTGTLGVARGGTGVATITGLVKGNGTSAMTAAVAGTDYVAPSGSITGNAGTATKLATVRSLAISGDMTWTVNFDGSANVTAVGTLATITDSGIGTFKKITTNAKGLVTGTQTVTQSDITGLLGVGSISNTMLANSAVANLSGTNTGDETTASIKTKLGISTLSGSNTGDQTITLTGDVTGSGTGSFATTLIDSGVTPGTYKSVSVNSKGLVTGATNPTTLAEYGITNAYTKTESDSALDLKVGFDDLDSVNLFRADRYLASQIVSKMLYDVNKELVKVRYNNNTDVDYEVLSYTDGKLTGVAHYIGGILKGNTVLQYVDGLLDSALFTAI